MENVQIYISSVAKVPCQGADTIKNNTCLMNFHDLYENIIDESQREKLDWVTDGTNIGPYFLPHPHPRRQQQSPTIFC